MREGFGRSVPINEGDEFEVKIEAVGEKGDGIAKKDGFVIFVPNTKEGDEVKIRVTRVLRRVGFGEVVGEGAPAAESGEEAAEATEETGEEAEKAGEETEKAGKETKAEEKEEAVEDTEDFGEDLEEEKK